MHLHVNKFFAYFTFYINPHRCGGDDAMGVRGCCRDIPFSFSHLTFCISHFALRICMAHTPWPGNAEWRQRSLLFFSPKDSSASPGASRSTPSINMRVIDRSLLQFFREFFARARDALTENSIFSTCSENLRPVVSDVDLCFSPTLARELSVER